MSLFRKCLLVIGVAWGCFSCSSGNKQNEKDNGASVLDSIKAEDTEDIEVESAFRIGDTLSRSFFQM